mmetsp:Transcript_7143/g.14095  ORF Transcript_7143/g.14095 Transcript_7143/m.14095 type:complete len:126 (-) Transcript_7143:108-485(-)
MMRAALPCTACKSTFAFKSKTPTRSLSVVDLENGMVYWNPCYVLELGVTMTKAFFAALGIIDSTIEAAVVLAILLLLVFPHRRARSYVSTAITSAEENWEDAESLPKERPELLSILHSIRDVLAL